MTEVAPAPARLAVVTGSGRTAHAVSGAVWSLLTAVGRWVDEVSPNTALGDYALVVVSDVAAWETVRARFGGPVLVVDADTITHGRAAATVRTEGTVDPGPIATDGGPISLPVPLPRLSGAPVAGVPAELGVRLDARTAYLLPVALSPSFRDPVGFWSLAAVLDRMLLALLGERAGPYVEPWPDGAPAARAVTCDLDDLDDPRRLERLATAGRPATLFGCGDALLPRAAVPASFEMAGHGDVHRPFADDATNLMRVDRMLEQFAAAGWALQGFSPPNLVYSSALSPLAVRFRHLRLGYQGSSWRCFPTRIDDLVVTRVSFYTDFLHRYVGHAECGRLLVAADAWASAVRGTSVPCFHPGLWSEPLAAYLQQAAPPAWEVSLAEIATWWNHRHAALVRMAQGEPNSDARLRMAAQTLEERLASVRPVSHGPAAARTPMQIKRVDVARRAYVVVPAGTTVATDASVPLDDGWTAARWLPSWCRDRLLRVANGGGVTAGLYSALPVRPQIRGLTVRLPLAVPEEPVLLTAVRWREVVRPSRPSGAEREVTLRA